MNIKLYIATGGPIGYTPFSGTLASLCACIILTPFFLMTSVTVQIFSILMASSIGWFCVAYAIDYFKKSDPSIIVYDEFVGMACAMVCISPSIKNIILSFLLFRFFDGLKWFGIRFFEKLPGAWGVMIDDIVAGCYASFCIQGLQWYGML